MNTWIIPPINMITHINDEARDVNCDGDWGLVQWGSGVTGIDGILKNW